MKNTLFLNLATYVPKADRTRTAGLKVNPNLTGHFLMGGTFTKLSLFEEPEKINFTSYWIWDEPLFSDDLLKAEKEVLKKVYAEFQEMWNAKKKSDNSPTTFSVGMGNTRMDLPFLYCRAMAQNIDTPENLYDVFLAGFPIDLSNVGSVFVMNKKKNILRPAGTNDLMRTFDLPEDKQRTTIVWDYFDNGIYADIESKISVEAENTVKLYYRMKTKVLNQWPKNQLVPKSPHSNLNTHSNKFNQKTKQSSSQFGAKNKQKSNHSSYRSNQKSHYSSKSSNGRSGAPYRDDKSNRGSPPSHKSRGNTYHDNKSSDKYSSPNTGRSSYHGKSRSSNRVSSRDNKSSNKYSSSNSSFNSNRKSQYGNKRPKTRPNNTYRDNKSSNKSNNRSFYKSRENTNSGSYRGKSRSSNRDSYH